MAEAPLVLPGGPWRLDRTQRRHRRCALTRRAGLWATQQVGRLARPVSQVAAELGVAWHTVIDAIVIYGSKLVDDPARIGGVEAIGVDETKWLAAKAKAPTRWTPAVFDARSPRVLDMMPDSALDIEIKTALPPICGRHLRRRPRSECRRQRDQ